MPVDVTTALDLKLNHNLSYSQIGAIQGVSKQAVLKRIKHLLPTAETKLYQDQRADILSNMQMKLLAGVTDDKIKKAAPGSLILSACQLYDKERLERGLSTGNFATITADIESIRAARHIQEPEPDSDPELT